MSIERIRSAVSVNHHVNAKDEQGCSALPVVPRVVRAPWHLVSTDLTAELRLLVKISGIAF